MAEDNQLILDALQSMSYIFAALDQESPDRLDTQSHPPMTTPGSNSSPTIVACEIDAVLLYMHAYN